MFIYLLFKVNKGGERIYERKIQVQLGISILFVGIFKKKGKIKFLIQLLQHDIDNVENLMFTYQFIVIPDNVCNSWIYSKTY